MVLFDTDFLSLLLHEHTNKIIDPKTKKSVERVKEKIRHLIDTLDKTREKILVPTPVLSEILCLCGDSANEVLAELMDAYGFEPAPFDVVAAVEAAIAISRARIGGGKKAGSKKNWAEVKFDRQIVAIAKSRGVSAIYSNDEDVIKYARHDEIRVISIWDLPEPPPQQADFLEEDYQLDSSTE